MNSENETKRKHARWYFWSPNEPFGTQTNGLAVEIRKVSWFKRKIGHAVIKDISLGGAGILVSNRVNVPSRIIVITPNLSEFYADVIYQRKEGDNFTFLGITWADSNDDERLELIAHVQKATSVKSRNEVSIKERNKKKVVEETN